MTIQNINKWLKTQGLTPFGEPIFRLIWSDESFEYRRGTFNDFYESIYLRTVTETRKVPKYNYIFERWVLEIWSPATSPELPESLERGSYEPFFVFEDKDGNYLPPAFKAVQFIINASQQVRSTPLTRASDLITEASLKEDKEVQHFMDQIDTSPISNALHMREGLGYTKGLKNA
jgi:hypothetical protein